MQTICLDGPSAPLDAIAAKVRRSKRIVVVSGAGMSCSAGIPDFRSKNGLYNLVKEEHPDAVVKGQDLFDANLFRSKKTTSVFFTFMAKLRAEMEAAEPTPAHHFLRHLRDRDQLMRIYTQNIDGYEARVGVKDRTVMLHGDIHLLRCTDCKHAQPWNEDDKATLKNGKAPICSECRSMEAARQIAGLRKRPTGVLRPQVVLYNEEHPQATEIGTIVAKDAKKRPDLLLIMGTSLKVDGIKGLVRDLSQAVRAQGGLCVFVNATPVSGSLWSSIIDYHVQSGIDEWVADLKVRAPSLWLTQSHINFQPAEKGTGASGGASGAPRGTPKGYTYAPLSVTKRKTSDYKDIEALKAKQARLSHEALLASLAWPVESVDLSGDLEDLAELAEPSMALHSPMVHPPMALHPPMVLPSPAPSPAPAVAQSEVADVSMSDASLSLDEPLEPGTVEAPQDPFARASWPPTMKSSVSFHTIVQQPAPTYKSPLNAWNGNAWNLDVAVGLEQKAQMERAMLESLLTFQAQAQPQSQSQPQQQIVELTS